MTSDELYQKVIEGFHSIKTVKKTTENLKKSFVRSKRSKTRRSDFFPRLFSGGTHERKKTIWEERIHVCQNRDLIVAA